MLPQMLLLAGTAVTTQQMSLVPQLLMPHLHMQRLLLLTMLQSLACPSDRLPCCPLQAGLHSLLAGCQLPQEHLCRLLQLLLLRLPARLAS